MMKMKKAAALTMAAATAISSLTMGVSVVSAEEKTVTITIGNWQTPEDSAYENREYMKEQFMKKYPNIIIETDEYKYGPETFLAKAASGQLPDLFNTYFTEIDKIVNSGYAQDITEAFNNSTYVGAIYENILDLVTKDGRIYGVPVSAYSMCMYCNVELFKEAGLVDEEGNVILPTTWDEVAQSATTIKEKTGKAGFSIPCTGNMGGWIFMNLAWGYGAEFETQIDDKWTATFDSEETVAALQYLKDLKWEYDAMPDDCLIGLNDWMSSYGTNQTAMGICHLGIVNQIIASTGLSKDNIAITAIPEGPAGKSAVMGGDLYMLSTSTTPEQQEAILKWLEFETLSTNMNEEQLAAYEETVKLDVENGYAVGPTGLSVLSNAEGEKQKLEIIDQYTNVDMTLWNGYCEHKSEDIKTEVPINAQELYAVLDSVIQEVLTNKDADCQALLTEAAQNFQHDYLDNAN